MQDLQSSSKNCFNVVGTINLWNLGLEGIDVLVECDSEKKLQYIENLCYQHPYTSYRARCFGDINGLLVQFNMPIGHSNFISELFSHLKTNKQIDNFSLLPFQKSSPIFTTPNVDFWNPNTYQWTFDWEDWFTYNIKPQKRKKSHGEPGTAKKWLTKSHLAIISELGVNARRKNIDIIKKLKKDGFDFTPQTFSRYLKKVKNNCIKNYRVFLKPTVFDLYSTVLIWGEADKKVVKDLEVRLLSLTFPFSSTFKTNQENLFWYLHLPPSHLSNLLFTLRKKLTDMHFNFIDYNRAQSYFLWPQTFDEEKQDWIVNEDFLLNNVVKNL
ncbi:MAG: hypothetical protein U9O98_11155 [Asgard group archaeon]|nr:hypothetical protein [Asgard group archaeon]